jgi:hypothetical protein
MSLRSVEYSDPRHTARVRTAKLRLPHPRESAETTMMRRSPGVARA